MGAVCGSIVQFNFVQRITLPGPELLFYFWTMERTTLAIELVFIEASRNHILIETAPKPKSVKKFRY